MPADAAASGSTGMPGAAVLGVGIAALDIVNRVAVYPPEDAEVRATGQRVVRGGNTANTLAVLRQLGHPCAWLGTLADDAGADLIRADLDRRGIDRRHAVTVPDSGTPTSYITLSAATGSRTIVHYRNLRELRAADFSAVPLDGLSWVHFEGRAPAETARMIARVRHERPGLPVSVEIEKPRDGMERLLRPVDGQGPDLLIFSRAFAAATAPNVPPEAFLQHQAAATGARLLLLPWGADGSYGLARGTEPLFAPAHRPAVVVETLAAGDVFNAAVIDGLLRGLGLPALLDAANRLAGRKCAQAGLDGLVGAAAPGSGPA